MTEFTADDKRAAILREIEQRKRVYPRLVERGTMTQAFADRQIQIMAAIACDYAKLAKTERLL